MTVSKFEILDTAVELDDDINKFTAFEIGAVERYTGLTMTEFGKRLGDTRNLSVLCWSALAWIAIRRAGKNIPYDEFMDSVGVVDLINALTDHGLDLSAVVAGAADAPRPVPNRAEKRHSAK
jgi:hypothetical protein